jgi:transposase-like protein
MSIIFPIDDLLDPVACYRWFEAILWPQGPCCPQCGARDRLLVQSARRAPLLLYECQHCGRIFNLFTHTVFEGTHYSLTQRLAIVRGVAQGVSTNQLCRELGCGYKHLLELRHKLQDWLSSVLLKEGPPRAEEVVEVDEMYQNAGEKRD